MNRKKSQKVFKHVLQSPFLNAWPDVTNEDINKIVNVLYKETVNQAICGIKIDNKIQKIGEANLESFSHQNLVLGINEIIKNIEKVSFVVMFKCDTNEVILEPLMLLCRNKAVKAVSGSFAVVYEKMHEITGVSKLAAFALPMNHCYPLTETFLITLVPKPSKKLLELNIKSVEITRKTADI